MKRSLLVLLVLAGCGRTGPAEAICGIDGGARAGVPLTLTATWWFSGCAAAGSCSVRIDGGALVFDTTATTCSTGLNPGGAVVDARCAVPPLEPGVYSFSPQTGSLTVIADGGNTLCDSF